MIARGQWQFGYFTSIFAEGAPGMELVARKSIFCCPGVGDIPASFFICSMSRINLRSRALLQGASHAARSSKKRQCPRHCTVPISLTDGASGSGSGRR